MRGLAATFVLLALGSSVYALPAAADEFGATVGGIGGSDFASRCPDSEYLAGFDLRVGDDVDSIRVLCANPMGAGLHPIGKAHGGKGGVAKRRIVCPNSDPIVAGIYVEARGRVTQTVYEIRLYCGPRGKILPGTSFKGEYLQKGPPSELPVAFGDRLVCPVGQAAVGAHGRTGEYLDALGLICGPFGPSAETKLKAPPVNVVDPSAAKLRGATVGKSASVAADLAVAAMEGPGSLPAGLSGTFKITIKNLGGITVPVELGIVFAGKLDQTGQIVAGAGLACAVGKDAGINAALRCTGGTLGPGAVATIVVQGRGQTAGAGTMVATLNASRSVAETNYNNNLRQADVTIK